MNTCRTFNLNTGALMPKIGLGTYKVQGYDTIFQTVDAALQAGYRAIDTASVYKNEADIWRSLETLMPKYQLSRHDIFITSKLAPQDHGSRSHEACMETIERLGSDYVDLFIIHWPGTQGMKPEDIRHQGLRKQSWVNMEALYNEGKLKAIGVSNYTLQHMEELMTYCTVKPALLQVEYHPYLVQDELKSFCKLHNIQFQAYSSLGTTTENNKLLSDPVITSVAAKYKKTVAQVLLRWAMQQDIGVIPKSTDPTHIKENIEIMDFTLTKVDMAAINALHKNEHFCWNPAKVV